MKKTALLAIITVLFTEAFAQTAPQGINYQAIARDASGNILADTTMSVRFTIYNSLNTSVFSEEHPGVTTSNLGLFNLVIGETSALPDFSQNPPHSLRVEIDLGSSYIDLGKTNFQSVPYALYAPGTQGPKGDQGPPGTDGAQGPQGPPGTLSVTATPPIHVTVDAATSFVPDIFITANDLNIDGYVTGPELKDSNKVWKTNSAGIPGWRDDARGIGSISTITANNGLSINSGNNITLGGNLTNNTTILLSGNVLSFTSLPDNSIVLGDFLNGNPFVSITGNSLVKPLLQIDNTGVAGYSALFRNRVGIGNISVTPFSLLSVGGNAAIGKNYSTSPAPNDGLIVEGSVGIGTPSPSAAIDIAGDVAVSAMATVNAAASMDDIPVEGRSVLRVEDFTGGGAGILSGFSGGVPGKLLYVYHIGLKDITLLHQGTTSLSQNQIMMPGGSNLSLFNDFSAVFIYDGVFKKWILLSYID